MRSRQAGITFIGWVVLLIPVAILVFAGLKLFPIYMNQFKLSQALQETAKENRGETTISPQVVRGELERRFDIESIDEPTPQDIVIERDGDQWVMTAQYDRETALFGNLSLLVHFNKTVVIQ